jgi:hypothetical protein
MHFLRGIGSVGSVALFLGITSPLHSEELRIGFAETCPMSKVAGRESGISAALTSVVVEVGGKLVGGLIDKLAAAMSDDQVVTFTASGRMEGFLAKAKVKENGKEIHKVTLNKGEGCLLLAVGSFSTGKVGQQTLFP